MLKEISYGAVVYKIEAARPMFLLARSRRSGNWGFPKGHIAEGESPFETAKREIYEETGISALKFIENFEQTSVYLIDGSLPETKGKTVEKRAVYFLALALSDEKKERDEEIEDLQWFSFNAALEKLSFEDQKKTLKEAYNKLAVENIGTGV
jgi:8-oxo-dGTP pyrophosphatase MutT (NUDIX family)